MVGASAFQADYAGSTPAVRFKNFTKGSNMFDVFMSVVVAYIIYVIIGLIWTFGGAYLLNKQYQNEKSFINQSSDTVRFFVSILSSPGFGFFVWAYYNSKLWSR